MNTWKKRNLLTQTSDDWINQSGNQVWFHQLIVSSCEVVWFPAAEEEEEEDGIW